MGVKCYVVDILFRGLNYDYSKERILHRLEFRGSWILRYQIGNAEYKISIAAEVKYIYIIQCLLSVWIN